jgi:probable F420-dependent oxidoreductase
MSISSPTDEGVTMKFGVGVFPTLATPSPSELARLAEAYGCESLFFAEHSHIPASRDTPYPGGGDLPPEYGNSYDPFVALAIAAAATERLLVATGICLIIQRDPIVTAKEVASLDRLSDGRLLFGVGAGWNREEMANHGTDPVTRMRLMQEHVEAMKAIWSEEEASYHGEFVSFDRIWCSPKPLQKPNPPVLVAGAGPTVLDRVLAFGDGWYPPMYDDDIVLGQVDELRARSDRDIPVTLNMVATDPKRLERYAAAGIDRVIFEVPQGNRSDVERRLDEIRAAMGTLTG